MAYNPNFGIYNPYNSYDLNNLSNQLNNLRQQQQQLQANSHLVNNAMPHTNVLQRGEFIVVNTIEDVENYPAPIDGTPVLIFVNGKNVFYNKKFENGNTKCQPNIHQPYNNGEPEKNDVIVAEEKTSRTSEQEIMETLLSINQRLEKLEAAKKTTRSASKKVEAEQEVEQDGI